MIKKIYKTKDGKEFPSYGLALEYEKSVIETNCNDEILKLFKSASNYEIDNPHLFVMDSKEELFEILNKYSSKIRELN